MPHKSIEARRAYARTYQKAWAATHREKVVAKQRVYRANHRAELAAFRIEHREEFNARARANYAEHREERRIRRFENREKTSAYNKAAYSRNPEKYKFLNLRSKYGISQEDYNAILVKQGGVCAICGQANWNGSGPHVDHDHVTGQVRGLLCNYCNPALGMVHDDPKIARAIAVYLEFHANKLPAREGADKETICLIS
jgi:hypothetical protein